jgi:transposase
MALTYFADAPMDRHQTRLFYPTLDDRIAVDHPVRILDELVDACDFSAFEQEYHGSRGQPPIPPQVLVKSWLYGLGMRIRSSRRLEYAIGHNLDFIWLVQGRSIDHVTLAKFRTKFKKQIKTLFQQVGKFAAHAGLLRLVEVTFDGTRVKANNGRSETLTAEGVEKRLAELTQEIDRLLTESGREDARDDERLGANPASTPLTPELADLHERRKRLEQAKAAVEKMDRERQRRGKSVDKNPAQIPITDLESRLMPNKEGGFAPNYTPLAAVDTHSGLIVSAGVLADVNEHGQTVAIIEQIAADFGETPERLLADGLHATGPNIAAFENRPTELLSPLLEVVAEGPNPALRADPTQPVPVTEWSQLPRNSQKKLDKACFVYDAEKDVFYCPQGQPLHYGETKPEVQAGGQNLDVWVYRCRTCSGCPLAPDCMSPSAVHGRTIRRDEFTEHRQRHATRMATPAAKEAYKRRLHAGETQFAYLKHVMGLRQFLLRGLAKVETEWTWACTAYNVLKLVRYIGNLRNRFAQQIAAEAI